MRVWVVAAMLAALAVPATASAGTVFLLDGRGWGHGVGMSQWGAEGYARHGWGYRQILAHYYPHTHIGIAPDRTVRVLLVQGKPSVRIGSGAPFVVEDAQGHKLHLPARSVVVDSKFTLKDFALTPPLTFEPGAQPLEVNFRAYRGEVVIRQGAGGLMAVNDLPLDRYLRGVVPSEMPGGWHTQTYEAQAVAARSYAIAMLHPTAYYDLFADDRSQVYGGIAAETDATNYALGQTAGQVLVWRDTIIPAYFFSSSGGKTSSVHDMWPKQKQVPYLVSVKDPYDYLSPHHVWPTQVLTADQVDATLGVDGASDMRVLENSSGRARAVEVKTDQGWRRFSAQVILTRFHLGSTDFDVSAMGLDTPPRSLFGSTVDVQGFVRGLGKARLEELTEAGWTTVRRVHVAANGHFAVHLAAASSAELRLAYNDLAGDPVALSVAPRVAVRTDGSILHAQVRPYLPLQVERLTQKQWKPVARSDGSFDRPLAPGSYRVAVLGSRHFASAVSKPVALRMKVVGP